MRCASIKTFEPQLDERGRIREHGQALRRGHRQQAQTTRTNVCKSNAGVQQVIHVTAEQVLQSCSGASVRDVQSKNTCLGLEHLAPNVGSRAIAWRAITHLAWIALGMGDELSISLVGGIAAHDQNNSKRAPAATGMRSFSWSKGILGVM